MASRLSLHPPLQNTSFPRSPFSPGVNKAKAQARCKCLDKGSRLAAGRGQERCPDEAPFPRPEAQVMGWED